MAGMIKTPSLQSLWTFPTDDDIISGMAFASSGVSFAVLQFNLEC